MQSDKRVVYCRVYSSATIGAIRSARIGTNTLRFALSITKVIVSSYSVAYYRLLIQFYSHSIPNTHYCISQS